MYEQAPRGGHVLANNLKLFNRKGSWGSLVIQLFDGVKATFEVAAPTSRFNPALECL